MRKIYIVLLVSVASISTIISCSKDGGGGSSVDCSTILNKAFAADINPIFQASCNLAGCHATGSFNGPGALTNYSQIAAAKNSIRTAISSGKMPQGLPFPNSQKNSIICWIDSGAPNN
ncbi:MAG: hypothetical protein WAT34_13295 [Chitinophagaceae bacterium]|nr:hypothetical protein [Chitinophagaceae bacterium]